MDLIRAVYKELSEFLIDSIAIKFHSKDLPKAHSVLTTKVERYPQDNQVHPENEEIRIPIEDRSSFRSVAEVVADRVETRVQTETVKNETGVFYTKNEETPVFSRPTREFDTVTKVLTFGQMVFKLNEIGNWAEIRFKDSQGWVSRDDLVSYEADVRPFFTIREYCGPESENTQKLRRYIRDRFYAGAAHLPLTCEEYVVYKLQTDGVALPSIQTRPRMAGLWQFMFKGISGVHLGVRPKTGSVMEYVSDDGEGRLAYVDAVFPDESITISEVGYPERGGYYERTLTKEAWQAYKPVFIQFT